MRAHRARRGLSIGLATLLVLGVSGAPTGVQAADDAATEALRELQAELDALFAPDASPTPDPVRSQAAVGRSGWRGLVPSQLAAGAADAPVAVTSIGFVEANAQVTLDWDDVLSIGAFEVLRDGAVVAEVDTSEFTDTVGSDATYDYEVRAIGPGIDPGTDPLIGVTRVAVPATTRDCDFSWTGAVDSDFADESNWAPIGGSPAVPKDGSHVCIDSRQNTPVTSIAPGAGVGTASTSLKADDALPALLDIAGGDFTVSSRFADVDLLVSDGSFASTGTTSFRLLTVTDGELALTGNATAPEGVQFGPGAPVVSSASGSSVVFDVSPPQGNIVIGARLTDAALTIDGPVQLGTPGDLVTMNGTSNIRPGAEGSTLASSFLVAESGVAQVDVSMSSLMRVEEGATLTVTDHQAFANATFPPQIALGGTLILTQPITRLGDVDYRSAAAQIVLNGGAANDFTGLGSINDMTIDEASNVRVRNDLQIRSLSMNNGATFTVDGELDYASFLALSGATITAPTVVTSGPNAWDGDIDVFGTANRIVGDVTTGGTIRLNSDSEVGIDARLSIDGSLALAASSTIESTVTGSDVTGRLTVRDEVALDGAALVHVNGTIPADTDVAAVSWGSATGTLDLDISGDTTDTTIEQKAGGIFVRRDGGGPGLDITAVVALGALLDAEAGAQITLAWPAVLDAAKYEIRRDGEVADDTTDTTITVTEDPGTEVTYSVVAVGGGDAEGETNLGSLALVIPDGDCSISWTGAISSAWEEPLNWMPISKESLPGPRVPAPSDDVCVDVATNAPVSIIDDVSIERLTSQLAPGSPDPLIVVETADVSVGTLVDVPSMSITDRSLTTDSLMVDDLEIGNAVVTTTTADIDTLRVSALGEESNDAEILGAATIDRVTQAAGTTLRVEDLQSADGTILDLAGSTTLDKEVAALAGLYLFEAGTLSVGGGPANVLSGLTQVDVLALQDTSGVSLPTTVAIGELSVSDAALVAGGDMTVTGELALRDGADLDIAGDLTLGAVATLAVTSTDGADFVRADIDGAANLDGSLTVDIADTVTALPFVTWAVSTGSFDTTSLTGAGSTGTELVVSATGISVEPVFVGPPALSVLGFDVGDGLGDVDLVLAWPTFDGASAYQVRRNDDVVTVVPGLLADVTSAAKATETWTIVALGDDSRPIGLVGSLEVLAAVNGCAVAWTGAIDDSWGEPLNWAPVVSGGALPAPVVPAAGDLACIHVDNNLPVQVTLDTVVGGVQSLLEARDDIGLADTVNAVEVVGSRLTATAGVDTSGLTIRGGTLVLGDASTLAGDLVVDDALVEVGGGLNVAQAIRSTGPASLFGAAGEGASLSATQMEVDGSTIGFDPALAVAVQEASLTGGVLVGGPLVTVTALVAESGDNIVSGVGTTLRDVVVDDGALLRVDQPGTLADTGFDVTGRLELVAPGPELGDLVIASPDAEIVVEEGEVNLLTGVKRVGGLLVVSNTVAFDGPLNARTIQLEASSLITDGNIEAAEVLSVGASSIEGGDLTMVSDPEGIFDPRIIVGTSDTGSTLSIGGNLALDRDTTVTLVVSEPPTAPLVEVRGVAALDGGASIGLQVDLPAGTDQPLVTWSSSTGSIPAELSGVGAGTAELVTTPTGLVLRSIVPRSDQVVAFGIEIGETDDDPSTIWLTWPALADATSYVIERLDGSVVATTTGTVATVSGPTDEVSEFVVVGFDDGKRLDTVGELSVLPVPGCDVAWTGAAGSGWSERLNWVPVVFDGQPLRSMRVPGPTDRACIGVETNLPVQLDADASIGSLLTIVDEFGPVGLPVDTEVLAVDDAELTVSDGALLASATLTDSTLRVGSGTVYGDLTIADATVEFTGSSFDIRGALTTTGLDDRVVSTAPGGGELAIDEVVAEAAELRFVGDVDSTIRRLELSDSTVRDGTSTSITELDATSGSSVLAVGRLAVAEVEVVAGADLTIPVTTRFDDTTMNVAGRLQLPTGFDVLGDLTLESTGAVAVGAGRDNDLTGIARIAGVSITENSLTIGNPVDMTFLELADAAVDVTGTLAVADVLTLGLSEISATTTVIETGGALAPRLTTGNRAGESELTVRGDLTLPNDGVVGLLVGSLPSAPLIVITGSATLAGDAIVSIQELPDSEVEIGLVGWGSATGTLTTTLVGDGVDPDKVDLRRARRRALPRRR